MPTKEERATRAAKHVGLMKALFTKEMQASATEARIYEDGEGRELEVPEARFEATEVAVSTDFQATALFKAKGSAAVVDPAAFTKPGGNYLEGTFGPEQMLCDESDLFGILQQLKGSYYDANRDYWCGQLYTDRCVYVPDVAFTRKGDLRRAGVIVVAAPHRAHALQNNRSERECDLTIANRIETIMRVAAANGADVLICNAFACGAMGYEAKAVAELFKAWIDEHQGVFEQVVFALPRASEEAFKDVFGIVEERAVREPVQAQAEEGDDGEPLGFDASDLPEGVTFRG